MPILLKQNRLYILILILLVFITYVNSLNNAFLSDDLPEIVQNPNVGNLLSAISTHPTGFIRPVIYWISFHIGGLIPFFFRITNVLFHLGSTILIFVILNRIHKSKKVAFFVASLFAVHPAIAEAVIWISGGMYAQYSFFFLLSLFFYIKEGRKFYWWSMFCFLLSLMSHPVMPVALWLVFPLFELVFGNFKKNWLKALPFLLLSIAYIFVNLASLPERETTLHSVHYQEKGIDNMFVLVPIAVSSYLQLLIFPKGLTLYHSELAFSQLEFSIIIAVCLIFLALLFISFRKNKPIFFWLSFFWLALAPTLTPFRLNWIVAERYLYLPSIGLFTSLGLILNKLFQKQKYQYFGYVVFTIAIILLSVRTMVRNVDWQNEDNLWIATGKTSPSSPNTHNNLGDVYGRQGDKQAALREFQTAIALKPNYGDAYHNLANTYRELGEMDKALENYQKATEYNPGLWQSYQNIAAIYFERKLYDKALENIQKAIEINPKNINLRNNLGIVFLAKGEKQKAKEIFQLVLSVDPQNQYAQQALIEINK